MVRTPVQLLEGDGITRNGLRPLTISDVAEADRTTEPNNSPTNFHPTVDKAGLLLYRQ